MNIDDIIVMIEDKKDNVDRAIAYVEVINYLKGLKEAVRFEPNSLNWKNAINDDIVALVIDDVDNALGRVTEMFKVNLV